MEAESSALDICLRVLRVIAKLCYQKGQTGNAKTTDEMEFSEAFLSYGKNRDPEFIIELTEQADEMIEDESFNEEILMKVAAGSAN